MGLLGTATVTVVGLTCKAFLNSGLCAVTVNGLHYLKTALEDTARRSAGQGVVTICNHISTLDDPVTWGVLPARYHLNPRTTRWALGASDIMFTNPLFSTFFSLGQTLETFRGEGIYQAAVDTAIHKLNDGHWVHLYGEGKVNQPDTYLKDSLGRACLPRFKWGVGRILMEASVPPVVIPMWITGFEQLMPEGRPFLYKYLPRIGARLSITFGEPVPADELREALAVSKSDADVDASAAADQPGDLTGWLGKEGQRRYDTGAAASYDDHVYAALIRQKVTAIIHRDVQALGRSVSGKLLTGFKSDS